MVLFCWRKEFIDLCKALINVPYHCSTDIGQLNSTGEGNVAWWRHDVAARCTCSWYIRPLLTCFKSIQRFKKSNDPFHKKKDSTNKIFIFLARIFYTKWHKLGFCFWLCSTHTPYPNTYHPPPHPSPTPPHPSPHPQPTPTPHPQPTHPNTHYLYHDSAHEILRFI